MAILESLFQISRLSMLPAIGRKASAPSSFEVEAEKARGGDV